MNNCQGAYEVTWSSGESVTWTYKDCDNQTEVALVTIDDGGHMLYQNEQTNINTTQLAWDFIKKFKK
jgi:poly(3-hydroxybutyrate) depolymerase